MTTNGTRQNGKPNHLRRNVAVAVSIIVLVSLIFVVLWQATYLYGCFGCGEPNLGVTVISCTDSNGVCTFSMSNVRNVNGHLIGCSILGRVGILSPIQRWCQQEARHKRPAQVRLDMVEVLVTKSLDILTIVVVPLSLGREFGNSPSGR